MVGLLILFSLAGAILPQEGLFTPDDIARWQKEHPTVTALLKPIGFFRVFHAIPLLATIFLLAVNILTCTINHLIREGGRAAFKGAQAFQATGFLLLHLSLIVLFAGGSWSAAASMDGYIVLTEGQVFKEERNNYLRIVSGPLRSKKHEGFLVRLDKVTVRYAQERFPVEIASNLTIRESTGGMTAAAVKINHPFSYRGLAFTQDETGFSPRLVIRDKASGRLLVDSFVALKTFKKGEQREYRDFLPLPFFKQRVIVTLYPAFTAGENPRLLVEREDKTGQVVSRHYLPFRGSIDVGDFTFAFTDLRRWSSFRVVADPGYTVVWIALWLGVVGFVLRYFQDLRRWFLDKKRS